MSLSLAAHQYIQAATYIDIPSITILYELSIRNHHTSHLFIYKVSTEFIQEDHFNNNRISHYPDEYTLRALVTYQLKINRSAGEIYRNLFRWTNGWIFTCDWAENYTVDRIRIRRSRYNSHVKQLRSQKAITERFKRSYILGAHRLGFTVNQIISHLLSHFPEQANSFTRELIYSVLAAHSYEIKAMTPGRRKWDSAGEKFMRAARNLGIQKEDMYCALIMARYDVECDEGEIKQAWDAEAVESSATIPQSPLPILVRASTNSTAAETGAGPDVAETVETGEYQAKSFANTSSEASYSIMARDPKSTTAENEVRPDAAQTGKDDAKSFAGTSSEDSYPVMARGPNYTTAANDV